MIWPGNANTVTDHTTNHFQEATRLTNVVFESRRTKHSEWPRIDHDQMIYCAVVTGQEICHRVVCLDRCLTSASHLPIFVPIWQAALTCVPSSKLWGIRSAELSMRKWTTCSVSITALAVTGEGWSGRTSLRDMWVYRPRSRQIQRRVRLRPVALS